MFRLTLLVTTLLLTESLSFPTRNFDRDETAQVPGLISFHINGAGAEVSTSTWLTQSGLSTARDHHHESAPSDKIDLLAAILLQRRLDHLASHLNDDNGVSPGSGGSSSPSNKNGPSTPGHKEVADDPAPPPQMPTASEFDLQPSSVMSYDESRGNLVPESDNSTEMMTDTPTESSVGPASG